MDFFPVLALKGKPFDMGHAHGRLLTRQINANLSIYILTLKESRMLKIQGVGRKDTL